MLLVLTLPCSHCLILRPFCEGQHLSVLICVVRAIRRLASKVSSDVHYKLFVRCPQLCVSSGGETMWQEQNQNWRKFEFLCVHPEVFQHLFPAFLMSFLGIQHHALFYSLIYLLYLGQTLLLYLLPLFFFSLSSLSNLLTQSLNLLEPKDPVCYVNGETKTHMCSHIWTCLLPARTHAHTCSVLGFAAFGRRSAFLLLTRWCSVYKNCQSRINQSFALWAQHIRGSEEVRWSGYTDADLTTPRWQNVP